MTISATDRSKQPQLFDLLLNMSKPASCEECGDKSFSELLDPSVEKRADTREAARGGDADRSQRPRTATKNSSADQERRSPSSAPSSSEKQATISSDTTPRRGAAETAATTKVVAEASPRDEEAVADELTEEEKLAAEQLAAAVAVAGGIPSTLVDTTVTPDAPVANVSAEATDLAAEDTKAADFDTAEFAENPVENEAFDASVATETLSAATPVEGAEDVVAAVVNSVEQLTSAKDAGVAGQVSEENTADEKLLIEQAIDAVDETSVAEQTNEQRAESSTSATVTDTVSDQLVRPEQPVEADASQSTTISSEVVTTSVSETSSQQERSSSDSSTSDSASSIEQVDEASLVSEAFPVAENPTSLVAESDTAPKVDGSAAQAVLSATQPVRGDRGGSSSSGNAPSTTIAAPPAKLPGQAIAATSAKPTPAANAPVEIDPAKFLSRVAKAFSTAKDRGGPVQLRLNPPELGQLRVEVLVQEGVMTAKLEAETASARTALLENLPQLRERLAEQGIRIDRFDVDLMQDQSQQNMANSEGNSASEQGFSQPRAAVRRESEAAPSVPLAAPAATSASLDRLNVVV